MRRVSRLNGGLFGYWAGSQFHQGTSTPPPPPTVLGFSMPQENGTTPQNSPGITPHTTPQKPRPTRYPVFLEPDASFFFREDGTVLACLYSENNISWNECVKLSLHEKISDGTALLIIPTSVQERDTNGFVLYAAGTRVITLNEYMEEFQIEDRSQYLQVILEQYGAHIDDTSIRLDF